MIIKRLKNIENKRNYKEDTIRLSADFSKEMLWTRRDWQRIFKEMKSKDLH